MTEIAKVMDKLFMPNLSTNAMTSLIKSLEQTHYDGFNNKIPTVVLFEKDLEYRYKLLTTLGAMKPWGGANNPDIKKGAADVKFVPGPKNAFWKGKVETSNPSVNISALTPYSCLGEKGSTDLAAGRRKEGFIKAAEKLTLMADTDIDKFLKECKSLKSKAEEINIDEN